MPATTTTAATTTATTKTQTATPSKAKMAKTTAAAVAVNTATATAAATKAAAAAAIAKYKLFTPLTLGDGLTLKNRVVMAPLTRARADPATRAPTELSAEYYAQRAGAGLIIAEATAVSEQGYGWFGSPALYTDAHAAAWKVVVDRVHAHGGKIFVQLWHMGRQGHSSFNAKRELVSASAVAMSTNGVNRLTKNSDGEYVPYETPRALRTDEVAGVVEDFRRATALAKTAGFDGVEIHTGNGYLVDQFLQTVTNQRTDKYGGSFENRARFLLEIVDAAKTVWSADRIGVRLSPNGAYGGMGELGTAEFYSYVMQQLDRHGLAYLAIMDGFGFGYHDKDRLLTTFDAKKHFKGTVLANCSYTRDIAEGAVRSGAADFVSFGRAYISTPDLAERFQRDLPLNADAPYEVYWDPAKGAVGYTDFPAFVHGDDNDGGDSNDDDNATASNDSDEATDDSGHSDVGELVGGADAGVSVHAPKSDEHGVSNAERPTPPGCKLVRKLGWSNWW